jgi:hypothetical protein
MKRFLILAVTMLSGYSFGQIVADEGMWLYTNPPLKQLEEKYGFKPSQEWLDHLQKSSIRFGNGGSASFVSPNGLVMTNHHVGVSTLQRMSTPERDLVEQGYYAKTLEDELKCPGIELNVLQEIRDVTEQIKAAVKSGLVGDAAEQARRAVIAKIESAANTETGMKCEVATFFNGGLYHLYCYKKYTDVRLVFAPEDQVGFFGGDPDNFEYPRYCLDVSFFRAYENDKPAETPNSLKFSENGAIENELVVVSGHPGRTDRFKTIAELKFYRDMQYPYTMEKVFRREVTLKALAETSAENQRRTQTEIFRWTNTRKVRLGVLTALQDESLLSRKVAEETELRAKITKARLLNVREPSPWLQIERALKQWEEILYPYDLLEAGEGFHTPLFGYARQIVRVYEESQKPNEKRLRGYNETALPTIRESLEAVSPLYENIEIAKLSDSLTLFTEKLGADDPLVKQILTGKSPQNRASELIKGTKLFDAEKRLKLYDAALKGTLETDDPMIRLALLVDKRSRELRNIMETRVEEPRRQAYAKIADARFKLFGTTVYPDATFTLRFTFGKVEGVADPDGTQYPPFTKMGGTFTHGEEHHFVMPYTLPETWMKARGQISAETPMNMISTNDTIGGNSGSPMVNQAGEIVGILFDGNRLAHSRSFVYDDTYIRAVSVCSTAIIEGLRSIYHTERLLEELGQKQENTK